MKKSFLSFFIPLLFVGCASVEIYSDSDLDQKSGLKICSAKPFLLVDYSSGREKPGKTSLIWLPDLTNPQYLRLKPGIGASELKLAFSNGTLTSYGIAIESEIPETISSLASLVSKSSDVIETFNTMSGQTPDTAMQFELFEIVIETGNTYLRQVLVSDE